VLQWCYSSVRSNGYGVKSNGYAVRSNGCGVVSNGCVRYTTDTPAQGKYYRGVTAILGIMVMVLKITDMLLEVTVVVL
jgi:hypothetical protein